MSQHRRPADRVARWTVLATLCAAALACAGDDAEPPDTAAEGAAAAAAADADSLLIQGEFQTPESVLHDETSDLYLVSNINGDPLAKDDNGFISRVSPDGQVIALKWVDGAAPDVTLHAPKGMAIAGDTLYVSDIDSVRAFHRDTGAPLGARGVAGSTFLNDLATGPDGTLYVSDSGFTTGFQPSGTDAIYRFEGDRAVAIASGETLSRPNGLAVAPDGLIVVPFGGTAVRRFPLDGGEPTEVASLPAGQLDGVVRLADGSLLVSSWEASSVYRAGADGAATAVVEGVEAPADIGYDARRSRVLVPMFNANQVLVRRVR